MGFAEDLDAHVSAEQMMNYVLGNPQPGDKVWVRYSSWSGEQEKTIIWQEAIDYYVGGKTLDGEPFRLRPMDVLDLRIIERP